MSSLLIFLQCSETKSGWGSQHDLPLGNRRADFLDNALRAQQRPLLVAQGTHPALLAEMSNIQVSGTTIVWPGCARGEETGNGINVGVYLADGTILTNLSHHATNQLNRILRNLRENSCYSAALRVAENTYKFIPCGQHWIAAFK